MIKIQNKNKWKITFHITLFEHVCKNSAELVLSCNISKDTQTNKSYTTFTHINKYVVFITIKTVKGNNNNNSNNDNNNKIISKADVYIII